MKNLQPVRGTRDLLGDQARRFDFIVKTAFDVAQKFGFERIDTPVFEYTNVFKRAVGETTDIVGKEMYTFNDRGDEELTLKPEGTAPVVRALISNALTQKLPLKFSYYGAMFRYERPQKGRYRQLHQFGVELFGIDNPVADAEIIGMGASIIKALGLSTKLHINTLGDVESRNNYKAALVEYFSKFISDLSDDSKNRLHKNPLRILDSKDEMDKKISENAPKGEDFLNKQSAEFYNKVCAALNAINIDFVADNKLVRGLDYYTHTAFEFKSNELGSQDAVGGGGRYDGLVEHMGGPAIPGVGFGIGVDRLAILLENQAFKKPNSIALIVIGDYLNEALKIAFDLRAQGHNVEIIYKNNIGKAFKEAEKFARYVMIIGEDEVKMQSVKLKDLFLPLEHPNKERLVAISKLHEMISNG